MRSCVRRLLRLGLVVLVSASFGLQGAPVASAAPGTVLRDLAVSNSVGGVSVAFDGHYLYYTNLDGAVLHRVAPNGVAAADVRIVGAAGINALSYDAVHDVFWGVDASGRSVYRIRRDGVATLQFTLVPAFDLPGLCDVPLGCSRVVSGLAYDATDSLWYAPQGTERIYHLTPTGELLGYFDTNNGSSALVPDCLTNGVSGLAAGKSSLFLSAGSCGRGFQYAKNDAESATRLGKYPLPGPSSGDVECDDVSFAVNAMWVRSASDGHLRAIEVPAGACALGGGAVLNDNLRWMSGSGVGISQWTTPVPHTLFLYCDQLNTPATGLSVNWTDAGGTRYSFRLTRLESTTCFWDGTSPCDPTLVLDTCFNVITGSGFGRLTINDELIVNTDPLAGGVCGDECGYVDFNFRDNGPAKTGDPLQRPPYDEGGINISDFKQGIGILISCGCDKADYRAHRKGQCSRS
jgi:hypothetical protein